MVPSLSQLCRIRTWQEADAMESKTTTWRWGGSQRTVPERRLSRVPKFNSTRGTRKGNRAISERQLYNGSHYTSWQANKYLKGNWSRSASGRVSESLIPFLSLLVRFSINKEVSAINFGLSVCKYGKGREEDIIHPRTAPKGAFWGLKLQFPRIAYRILSDRWH